MRDMALSDLSEVARRLAELQAELSQKTARNWTQQDIAAGAGIAYRTYQTWVGGKNENQSGEGYDKLARFYSRKLGRKVTRRWILMGDPAPRPEEDPPETLISQAKAELRAEIAGELDALATRLSKLERAARQPKSTGS